MIVIYGIGSYFKRNRESVHDTCDDCGHVGWLRCYDAERCFSLYGIPVLPVGRKHVLGECPKCRSARMVPLKRWRQGRAETLPEAVASFEADRDDRDAALEALGQCVAFHDRDAFVEVALMVEEGDGEDADMIAELAGGYAFFGMYDEAEAAYRASLDLADRPETRAALAYYLVSVGKLDEAVTVAEPLVAAPMPEAVGTLVTLGEALHNRGDHEAAMAMLDAAREAAPELDNDKAFRKFHKKVGKRAARAAKPLAAGEA